MSTPGHGQGEGSAGDKFRVSGTQETVEGAGANEVSGVLEEAGCCRCGAPLIKKKRPTLFSRPLEITAQIIRNLFLILFNKFRRVFVYLFKHFCILFLCCVK